MVPALQPRKAQMHAAAGAGFSTATDLADYVVGKGIPFRDAHEIVGQAVALAIQLDTTLDALSLEQLQGLCPQIDEDVYSVLTLEGSVAARDHLGGTAPKQVRQAAHAAQARLAAR